MVDNRFGRCLDRSLCAHLLAIFAAIAAATTAAPTTPAALFTVLIAFGGRAGRGCFVATLIIRVGFGFGAGFAGLLRNLLTIATATAAAAAAATAIALTLAIIGAGFGFLGLLGFCLDLDFVLIGIFDHGAVDPHMGGGALIGIGGDTRLALFDVEVMAGKLAVGGDGDAEIVADFELRQRLALEIENVERDFDRHAHIDRLALLAQDVILDMAHDHQRQALGGTHDARAIADRALVG